LVINMNIKNIFKKEFVVGLDIGENSVKIAQFKEKNGILDLIKADFKELEKCAGDSLEEKTITALRSLLRGVDQGRSKINVSINCPNTFIKKCTVPYMPKGELSKGIKLELKNYFPFALDDSEFDYQILEDVVKKGVRKYEVALAISPRKTIAKYLSLIKQAGIKKPFSFVPSSFALEKFAINSTFFLKDRKASNTLCIIDIGEFYTELIILRGRELMFSRKIPITGRDFTKSLTSLLVSDRGKTELAWQEAEKIKRDVGIPNQNENKVIDNKITARQILSMLRLPLDNLVNEIDRCFHYYREEASGDKMDRVILFGGGASLTGLVHFLSQELDVDVNLGDSLESFATGKDVVKERGKISHRLEFAIGAAFSGINDINLLPAEIKEETKMIVRRSTIEVLVTAVLLISAFLYIGMKIQLGNLQTRIRVAQKEFASLDPQHKKAEAHHLANMVLIDEPHWEDAFKELSNIVPESIHLTSLSMKDNIIFMNGIVNSSNGERILSDFVLTLEKEMFTDVKLISIVDLQDKDGNKFKLKCWID